MTAIVLALALVILAGCGPRGAGGSLDAVDVYSRAEVDAINARMQCRNIARSMLALSRCETR